MIIINRIMFAGLLLVAGSVRGQSPQFDPELSRRIDSLRVEDQKPMTGLGEPAEKEQAFKRVIRSNFPLVRAIADAHGFPGYDLVGKPSSDNYWLLVQHSDFDLPFQRRILGLMQKQVARKNASGDKYAYLIDRISINQGRKQVYGTQVNMGPGGTVLKPCLDPANLDKRRKSVGLDPVRDYLRQCDALFRELNKGRPGME
jgi:hypothetical protein